MNDPIFQRIHVSQLHVDPMVQRATDLVRAKGMGGKFDINATAALIVSHRDDGKYFVVDGGHRLAAALFAGYDGKLLCIVHEGMTQAEEAALFLLLNDSKLVQAIDKFRVRVMARDLAAVHIHDALDKYGWRISTATRSVGAFAAVGAIEKVYYGAGILPAGNVYYGLLDSVLFTLTKAWDRNPAGAHSAIVGGLGQLFARYVIGPSGKGGQIDLDKLVHEMSKTRPVDLVASAKGIRVSQGGTVSAATAKVLVGLHNKSRRTNRLPDWRWTT